MKTFVDIDNKEEAMAAIISEYYFPVTMYYPDFFTEVALVVSASRCKYNTRQKWEVEMHGMMAHHGCLDAYL